MDQYQPLPKRPRRLRRGVTLRDAVADISITHDDLILPLFVTDKDDPQPVESMPGVSQLPVKTAIQSIGELTDAGLRQFILFGVTSAEKKDPTGRFALSADAPVNQTLAGVRDMGHDVTMIADLCFCEYTDHGHCGVLLPDDPKTVVDNDQTLDQLRLAATCLAQAGADVVAPSGMMDGQIQAIRGALDEASFTQVCILAYSIKYASSLYDPFRDAGQGSMQFGDRKGYQMDFRRSREWQTELQLDIEQGADMVMVKPAATYLDIIHQVRQACHLPLVAYHVSGEYAMLHAAARQGWLDLKHAALETTYAIKRAGADLIVTYFAKELSKWIR